LDLFLPALDEGLVPFLENGDRILLGRIAQTLRFESAGASRDAIQKAARIVLDVLPAEQSGATPIWDAVDESITRLTEAPGYKAVIVVTDGMPTGNRVSLTDVVSRAVRAQVVVHSILETRGDIQGRGFSLADSSSNPWMVIRNPYGTSPEKLMRTLALNTAGEFLADDERDAPRRLGKLLADLMRIIKREATIAPASSR
jgi:hypothetical protein